MKIPRPPRVVLAGLLASTLIAGVVVATWQLEVGPFEGDGSEGLPTDLAIEVAEVGESAAADLGGEPPSLLYLSGTSLRQIVVPGDNNSGEPTEPDRQVGEVPVTTVAASPGSSWVAYVSPEGTTPVVTLKATDGDDEIRLGIGAAPLWNHTGTAVAFLRPKDASPACSAAGCSGQSEVVVADLEGGSEVLLDEAAWRLVGWAGGRLLVVDGSEPTKIVSVSLDGQTVDAGVDAAEFVSASPDGKWIVVRDGDGRIGFQAMEDGRASGDVRSIEVPTGGVPLDPVWAPTSERIAMVLIEDAPAGESDARVKGEKDAEEFIESGKTGPSVGATGRVFTVGAGQEEAIEVEQTPGAFGTVYWSVDASAITYTRAIAGEDFPVSQAIFCPIGSEGSCDVLFSWNEEVRLLRMQ